MVKGQLSSKQPEKTQTKKPILEYNNKSYQSFLDNGLEPPESLLRQERKFVARVSDRYPINRNVIRMVRERILDSQTNKMREVLTYYEDWFGRNWVGSKLPPVRGHLEGMWIKQTLEPELDDESHEISGYKAGDQEVIYDYDFSDTLVNSILEKSDTADPELVTYYVKGAGGRRDGALTYEQFITLTWDECNNLLFTPGGFAAARIKQIVEKTNISTPTPTPTPKQK